MVFLRFLIASLALLLIGQTPFVAPLRATAAAVGSPVEYGAYHLGQNLRSFLSFYVRLSEINQENFVLKERVAELESRLVTLKEALRENRLLREQLDLGEGPTLGGLILAQIVGRPSGGEPSRVVISKGSDAGVREGAAVVVKNFLVGEVAEVSQRRATVRLLTDSEFLAAAMDRDSPDRARGLVKGRYGTSTVLEKVLPDEEMRVGDTVITSGEDEKFAKGLVLGKIESLAGAGADVFRSAKLQSLVDFSRLEEVFVIR